MGYTLVNSDCLSVIEQLKQENAKVQLIVTSPPYNIGKQYEETTSLKSYVAWQTEVIAACVDLLSETGSICWQVGHYIEGTSKTKEAYPLDLVFYPVFKDLGLKLRNRIIWHFGHGLHDKYRFSGRHETILWFTKSDEYVFNLDPVRVPQTYPNKRYFKGKNKGKISGNPLGKNPSDVWNIPNVKNNHIEKTDHPCQFPVGLVERLVLALSNVGDTVFDPFMGSGSSGVAALLHSRAFIGSDIVKSYVQMAEERLKHTVEGTIKIRPMNKPVDRTK